MSMSSNLIICPVCGTGLVLEHKVRNGDQTDCLSCGTHIVIQSTAFADGFRIGTIAGAIGALWPHP